MKNKFLLIPLIILSLTWIIWGVAFLIHGSAMGNAALLIGSLIGIGSIPWADSKVPDCDIVIFNWRDIMKGFFQINVMVLVLFCVTVLFSVVAYYNYGLWAGALAAFIGCAIAIGILFFDNKEKPASESIDDPGDGIIISQRRRELLKKTLRSKVVTFGTPIATGFLGTAAWMNYGILPGISVVLTGLAIGAGIIFLDSKYFPDEDDPKDEQADGPVDEIIIPEKNDGALEYLAMIHQDSSFDDCLVPHINSIVKRATRLLAYQKNDGVIGEILVTYRIFIEQYIGKAAELVKQSRKIREYLDSIDCNKIDSEISHLQTDAVSEEGVAKKTLDEKLRTKAGLEAMRKKQHSIQLELGLIDATLESMETIAITAETNDASAKDVRDELQRVISSTTLAIEETLCEHSV